MEQVTACIMVVVLQTNILHMRQLDMSRAVGLLPLMGNMDSASVQQDCYECLILRFLLVTVVSHRDSLTMFCLDTSRVAGSYPSQGMRALPVFMRMGLGAWQETWAAVGLCRKRLTTFQKMLPLVPPCLMSIMPGPEQEGQCHEALISGQHCSWHQLIWL